MIDNNATRELVAAIESDQPDTRTKAWLGAGKAGPAAFDSLARVMATGSLEVSRAAKRAMWKITHTVGAPGAEGKTDACRRLAALLSARHSVEVRREVLWMLSDLDDGQSVPAIAQLLKDELLRGDARMVLQRIPGAESLAALKHGFRVAPEAFKFELAQSLRKRGVAVDGYPCQKLVPNRNTQVTELK